MMLFITIEILLVVAFLLKNKFVQILFLGMSLSYDAWLVAVADARHNPDYLLYQTSYDNQWTNFEAGYTYLAHFFSYFGYNYVEFRTAFSVATFIIFFVSILLISENPSIIGVAFNFTLFLIGSIQIRNMAMLAIVLLGYSITAKLIHSRSKYLGLLIVFMGTLIHSLGWLFFITLLFFLLLKSKDMQKFSFEFISGVSFFLALITFIFSPRWLNSIFSKILDITRIRSIANVNIASVYSNGPNHFSLVMFCLVVFILMVVLSKELYKNIDNNHSQEGNPIVFGLILLSVSTFLFQLSVDYVRLLGNIWIFAAVVLANVGATNIIDRVGILFKIILGSVVVFALLMYIYPPALNVLGYTIGLYENDFIQ